MVLPEPLGPTSAATSPGRMVRETPCEGGALGVGVAEVDALEADAPAHGPRDGRRLRRRQHPRLQRHELVVVGEEEVVLVERGEAAQHRLQRREAGLEGLVVHHHGAQADDAGDGLPDDVGEGAEDGEHRDGAAAEVGPGAPAGDADALLAQDPAQVAVEAAQELAEAEEADLLGRRAAGEQPVQVPGLALGHRAPALPAVQAAREAHPHERPRDGGEHDDQADAPVQREEQPGHGDHADEALHGGEQVGDDARGP